MSDFKNINIQKKHILIIIFVYIVSSVFRQYYLGGDDTRLFYLYPEKFLNNFSANIATNVGLSSITSFLPPSCIYFFSLLMVLLKKVFYFINLQSLLYALNNVVGVYFFYKILKYVTNEKKFNLIFFLSSLLYVFSIFNVYVLFSAKLISIFLISIVPFSIYFLTEAVKEKKYYNIGLVLFIWTIFSLFAVSLPWFSGLIITLVPLILWIIKNNLKNSVITVIILLIVGFLFNINWITNIKYSQVTQKTQGAYGNSIASEEFRIESSKGIADTASLNKEFYPVFNLFHRQIQINYNWPYLPLYNNWYIKLVYVNWIFFAALIIAGIIVSKTKYLRGLYYASVGSFFLANYFYTVNVGDLSIGNIGINLFIWLNNNIPGFVMYRNMYDKFAFAMSFTYAFAFALSIYIILKNIKSVKLKNFLMIFMAAVILLNIKPAVFNDFDKLSVWTTKNTFNSIEGLNPDYLKMTEYVEEMNDYSKHLTLPLAHGNITAIADIKQKNHYYIGLSPFLIMSGKNDFSGGMSFGTYGDEVMTAIANKEYDRLGRIFQIFNIRYINVNNTLSEELKNSYLYSEDLYIKQDDMFYKALLGEKIMDFGDSYTLYKINNKYDNAKIMSISDINEFPEIFLEYKYDRISDSQFEFEINKNASTSKLVFLEPYNKNWSLYVNDMKVNADNHYIIYNYANYWDISALSEGNYHAKLYFEPKRYQSILNTTSLFLGLAGVSYYIFMSIKRKRL